MSDSDSVVDGLMRRIAGNGDARRTTALVAGSVAFGGLLTGVLFRKIRDLRLLEPHQLEKAFEAETGEMEIMEGRARFYRRAGTGVPVVLLHSINAAASSHEMKPIFEELARRTSRPLYALDWLGFGRSDRVPVRYSPGLYQRQLRRFLSEHVHQPADVVAVSLAAEYTAEIARTLPYLVNRLVLISPTGLSGSERRSSWQRRLITLANTIGLFEIYFYRLTRPELLRRFYRHQVFRGDDVPEDLVDYARRSTLVHGAHHAPRHFVQGKLALGPSAATVYAQLRVPTLILAPENDADLVQRFDHLDTMAARNPEFIHVRRLPGGLLPHWEEPEAFFEAIGSFLILSTKAATS